MGQSPQLRLARSRDEGLSIGRDYAWGIYFRRTSTDRAAKVRPTARQVSCGQQLGTRTQVGQALPDPRGGVRVAGDSRTSADPGKERSAPSLLPGPAPEPYPRLDSEPVTPE